MCQGDPALRDNPNKFYCKRFLERSIDVKGNVLEELSIKFLSIQPKKLAFLHCETQLNNPPRTKSLLNSGPFVQHT